MIKLTLKQEKFCQELVKTGNKSEAYRRSYNVENTKDEVVHVKATELSKNGNVSVRIAQLQEKEAKKYEMSIEKAIKFDLQLINQYQSLLKVLNNPEAPPKEIEAAKRTMRYIGTPAYNGAMDRVAKITGLFEKDNKQKQPIIQDMSEDEKQKRIEQLMNKASGLNN